VKDYVWLRWSVPYSTFLFTVHLHVFTASSRGMHSISISKCSKYSRFVDCDPLFDFLSEFLEAKVRIVFEPEAHHIADPSPLVLQFLRQVKVVKGNKDFDPLGLQLIND